MHFTLNQQKWKHTCTGKKWSVHNHLKTQTLIECSIFCFPPFAIPWEWTENAIATSLVEHIYLLEDYCIHVQFARGPYWSFFNDLGCSARYMESSHHYSFSCKAMEKMHHFIPIAEEWRVIVGIYRVHNLLWRQLFGWSSQVD